LDEDPLLKLNDFPTVNDLLVRTRYSGVVKNLLAAKLLQFGERLAI
jgi:hypothetical protein